MVLACSLGACPGSALCAFFPPHPFPLIFVGIPNGHPQPFSLLQHRRLMLFNIVSIPNGHPQPFSPTPLFLRLDSHFSFKFLTYILTNLAKPFLMTDRI